MLKRNTKVISLLVATVSIMTTIQVSGAELQESNTQEGTVSIGKAFGNGMFFVEGYKTDNDSTAIYSVGEDGSFNNVYDDVDSDRKLGDKIKDQYVEIDGDTYVDLKNDNKIVDDNIRETMVDDASKALKNKIKKDNDGRFEEDYCKTAVAAEPKRFGETSTFFDGFSGQWSHYQYKLNNLLISDKLAGNTGSYSTVYADLSGNYIDGDYNLGKLKVITTSASVTLKNTKDTYEISEDGKTYVLKAEIKEDTVLSEGYGDIYRTANLTIYRKEKGHLDSEYVPITSELKFGGSDNCHKLTEGDSVKVLQKISKEASTDSIDGIKYPKSSDIYFITDEDGNAETILGLCNGYTGNYPDKIEDAGRGYGIVTTNIKGITSFYVDAENNKIYAEALNLKRKKEYNYVDIGDYDTAKAPSSSSYDLPGGELWCIDKGYIEVWDGKENFEKVYKVDRSMNKMSINDKDNIIVWDEDGDAYSIIYNKPQTEQVATTSSAVTVTQTGWSKNSNGTWSFIKVDGNKAIGWVKDGDTWYYLSADGTMATGWVNDNGIWYYCNVSGAMLFNTSIDGYVLGADGAWVN